MCLSFYWPQNTCSNFEQFLFEFDNMSLLAFLDETHFSEGTLVAGAELPNGQIQATSWGREVRANAVSGENRLGLALTG